MKKQFFQSSYDEIPDLKEKKKYLANTQKVTKSVATTLFVFCMEGSVDESPAKKPWEIIEVGVYLFSFFLVSVAILRNT